MSAAYVPMFKAAVPLDTKQWALVRAVAKPEDKADPVVWLDSILRWCADDDANGYFNYCGGTPGSLNFFFSDHETAFRFKIRWG